MANRTLTYLDPAYTVIKLFASESVTGETVISEGIGVDRNWVYRWQVPRSKGGTDGRIPGSHYRGLRELAQKRGINLPYELLTGESLGKTRKGKAA